MTNELPNEGKLKASQICTVLRREESNTFAFWFVKKYAKVFILLFTALCSYMNFRGSL